MAVRVDPVEEGRKRGRRLAADLAREFREARVARGKSQRVVAEAVGITHAQVSRFECGLTAALTFERLAAMLACVGLDLSVRTYPGGDPLRDAAQVGLREALRDEIHQGLRWRTEVGLPIAGDRRAWDAVIAGPDWEVGIEVESRIVDLQALERRLALKQRDGAMEIVVLVLLDSRANRSTLRAYADQLAGRFPVPGREVLDALANGDRPRGSGVVLLKPKPNLAR